MVNSGITTGTLLWAWELYGASLRDFALQIPESGGKVPDFLAEIQWNLQWMLSLQDSDGGVWQKQSRDDFCSFIMPQDELGPNYVIGTGSAPYKSTCATADLAAVMAIAARCYSSYAPEFSQQCLKAARAAWNWCQNNPDVFSRIPPVSILPNSVTATAVTRFCGQRRSYGVRPETQSTGMLSR